MGRVPKTPENIFPIPSGATVTRGYVYLNTSSFWTRRNGKLVPDHDKLAIGIAVVGKNGDWKSDRRMYANKNFHEIRRRIKEDEGNGENGENGDIVGCDEEMSVKEDSENEQTLKMLQEKAKSKIMQSLNLDSIDSNQLGNIALLSNSAKIERCGSVNIGLFLVVHKLADKSHLTTILFNVFEEEVTSLILDIALYATDRNRMVYQHFPTYAKDHAIFSDKIPSDGYISSTLKHEVTLPKINLFRYYWAQEVLIGSYELYLYYDSSNVNSQCKSGVELIQMGHAKDDPSLPQVNLDFVIRQKDGLPVTFTTFPGSIPDITEASDMFEFFKNLLNNSFPNSIDQPGAKPLGDEEVSKVIKRLTFVCDRGYISKPNVQALDKAGMGFLLLLRGDMNISKEIIDKYYQIVKSRRYELEVGVNGITVTGTLFDGDDTTRYFHIIYDENLRPAHENDVRNNISIYGREIEKHITAKTVFTDKQLNKYRQYFLITTEIVGCSEKTDAKGTSKRKKSGEDDEKKYIIVGFEEDYQKTDKEIAKCGFMVLVSSNELPTREALEIYRKRDRVEKNFMTLKSFLDMGCFRGHSSEAIHAKALIWFVAAIIHTLMFNDLEVLKARSKNKKRYTVPAIVDYLGLTKSIIDMRTGRYTYYNHMSKFDRDLFNCFGISEKEVYEFACSIEAVVESDYEAIIDTSLESE